MRFSSRINQPQVKFVLSLALAVMAMGCVTTDLAPISSLGATYQPLEDELDLWADAQEQELIFLEQSQAFHNIELQSYLEALLERLEPSGMATNQQIRYRVRVVRDPSPSSFAYPHGTILLNTGLLARLDNEAQLAAVLAHEMTHIENRHMARFDRSRFNRQVAVEAAAITADILFASDEEWEDDHYLVWDEEDLLSDQALETIFELVAQVTTSGYGRSLETEAHQGVVTKLRSQGYDVREAMRLYEDLDEHFQGSHAKPAAFRAAATHLVTAQSDEFTLQAPLVTDRKFAILLRPVVSDFAELHAAL